MMMEVCPPKVSGIALAVVMPLAPELRAICAAPMVSGSRPNSLVRVTRTEEPPRETWTISRRVVPSVPGAPNLAPGLFAAMGEAAQVPTQWSGWVAAEAMLVMAQQNRSASRGSVVVLQVMTVLLFLNKATPHLTAVPACIAVDV
jgi:hypothetical protein